MGENESGDLSVTEYERGKKGRWRCHVGYEDSWIGGLVPCRGRGNVIRMESFGEQRLHRRVTGSFEREVFNGVGLLGESTAERDTLIYEGYGRWEEGRLDTCDVVYGVLGF